MKAYWIAGIVIAAGLPLQANECSVDVYVNYGAPMLVPLHPELETTAMFGEIGVNVRMRTGSPPHEKEHACGAPIMVELDDSSGYPGGPDALAYAMPYKESGSSIHIFLDRLIRNREPAFVNVLLAHVMVHEITHVLEHSTHHSGDGVMKARWSHEDYQLMRHRPLPFVPEDVEGIREGVARRIVGARAPGLM
jgi:hypothetical protein